jgi:hypothetical protein
MAETLDCNNKACSFFCALLLTDAFGGDLCAYKRKAPPVQGGALEENLFTALFLADPE